MSDMKGDIDTSFSAVSKMFGESIEYRFVEAVFVIYQRNKADTAHLQVCT